MAFALLQSGLILADHYIAFFERSLRALLPLSRLRERGRGSSWLAHFVISCCLLKPAARILAARLASEVCDREAPRKVRAARDAGVLTDPRACASRETQAERYLSIRHRPVCRDRKSAISPASRARCLKPAPHDPRWPLLFRLPSLSGAEASPPLGDHRQRLADGNRRTALPPWVPSDARARAPGPCSFGCFGAGVRVAPFPNHRPRSAPQDASGGAPRGSRRGHCR